MTYYVSVGNGVADRYTATVIGWPNCVAEGPTREEAIERVKQRFIQHLSQVEIVPIEIESPQPERAIANAEHGWAKFAGMYQTNPLFDEVIESIQAYRDTIDEDETVV